MDWGLMLRMTIGAFFGALGFAWLVHAPRHSWFVSGLIASFSFFLYWILTTYGVADPLAVFCGALFGSLSGHLAARMMRIINTVFLMSAIVPTVPGLALYRMMAAFGQGETAQGADLGIQAMITIAMIALGLMMGNFLDRLLHTR